MSLLVLTACGASPLFNHRTAGLNDGRTTIVTKNDCPLSFPKAGLCAAVEWLQVPAEGTTGTLSVRFWSAGSGTSQGPFTAPAQSVAVKLWMPDMGHGSSPVTVSPDSSPGTYRASGVYFVMPGTWEIWVQLKDGNTVVEQAKLDYSA